MTRLPSAADGALELAINHDDARRISIKLEAAKPAALRLHRGRAVYENVYPSTDAIFVAGPERFEELLLLRDASAPRELAWRLELGAAIASVAREHGSLAFRSAAGELIARVPEAYAIDAGGTRRNAELAWTADGDHAGWLAVRLDSSHLTFPILLDPSMEVFEWLGRYPTTRVRAVTAFDTVRGKIVLQGGSGTGVSDSVSFTDTWEWDGSAWLARATTGPSARRYSAYAYDSARGRLVVFGGTCDDGVCPAATYLADTWEWDGTSWTKRAPATSPSARSSARMAYDGARSKIVLFGGYDGTYLADTWEYDGTNWTKLAPATSPGARFPFAMAYDSARARTVLFGGHNGATLTDTWEYNGTTWSPKTPATIPTVAAGDQVEMTYDSGHAKTLMLTGTSTWQWDGTSWTKLAPAISPTDDGSIAYDPTHNKVVLLGGPSTWTWDGSNWAQVLTSPIKPGPSAFDSGRGKVVTCDDTKKPLSTWEWDGVRWTQRSTASAPSVCGSLAYDAQRAKTVSFFENISTVAMETWEYDGTSWTKKSPTASPPDLHFSRTVYDSGQHVVLAFGYESGNVANTWTYDGTTWTKKTPITNPPGQSRRSIPLAYDALHAKTVLFSGNDSVADTWLWDGSDWSKVTPATSPPARQSAPMAYDSARGRVVLMGGTYSSLGTKFLGDVWEWDGTTWAQRSSDIVPFARANSGLAFDSARGRVVLMGGFLGGLGVSNYANDTWEFQSYAGACVTDAQCDSGHCEDGICCKTACGVCQACNLATPGTCASVTNAADSDSCSGSCDGAGKCKRAVGDSCSTIADCQLAYCVDGFCCDAPCTGKCQACSATKKGSGADGVCDDIKSGSDPDAECSDDGANTCQHSGMCDGAGACQLYADGTSCGATTCAGGTQNGHSCDGFGTCDASNVTQCAPYVCSGSACGTSCSGDGDCVSSSWCRTGDHTCQAAQSNGASCSATRQCSSANCVDGLCCDQACDGLCQACSKTKKGSGSDGVCGSVKAGSDPDGECPDDGSSGCDRDGSCNGAGACELYANGTSCGATTCTAGTQNGFACNGLGTCNAASSSSCNPYACLNASVCASSCSDDNACVAADWCKISDHTCQPAQAKGASCTTGRQCTTGNCVDGFCCDSPCDGDCQACSAAKTGGKDGTCKAVTLGTDPDAECPDDGASSCARDGMCDGVGACRKYGSGTACGTTTCSGGTQTGHACDGAGTCKASQTSSCSPYVCQSGACGVSCASDADCVASAFCDGTSHCAADQGNGATCASASQCSSGSCADGVCCDQACSGTCKACSKAKKGAGKDGVCDNVVVDTDPKNDCAADAPATCQKSGNCDGAGACKLYGPGTACGAAVCAGSTLKGQQCDGFGNCAGGQTSKCDPFVCLVSSCATSCGDDNGCVAGAFCQAGVCIPKSDNGQTCSAGHECQTGFCVEGICCDTACNGVCQACTAANKESGNDGECGLAKAGSDAHSDCDDEGPITCKHDGACDGKGACELYASGTACGMTSCVDNVQTGYACDGTGVCHSDTNNDCGLFVCMAGACTVKCAGDEDCAKSAYCDTDAGSCVKRSANGKSCSAADRCASGFCVDGVCCDSVCGSQCQACDIATAKGTCSPVVGAPHGDRAACAGAADDDACSARACDGEKSTASCVGYVGADEACRDQVCSDGVETFSATCDNNGTCGADGPVKTKKCEPYVCDADGKACQSSCAADADCAAGNTCDASSSKCVSGATCDGDHTVTAPNGEASDCSPFKCEGSTCRSSCASVDDCVDGFVCDANAHCTAPSNAAKSSDGCGCRAAGSSPGSRPIWPLASLLGLLVGARRRRRARPAQARQ